MGENGFAGAAAEGADARWYVVRVKANAEWKVALGLTNRGMKAYLPVQKRASKGQRHRSIEIPLFPGYVFAQFDFRVTLPVLTCPGVVHILCRGTTPEPVDPVEMYALQSVSRIAQSVEPLAAYASGQRVKINSGPLAHVEGIVIRDSGRQRIIVSISLLRRSVVAEIARECLGDAGPAEETTNWYQAGA